jgi:muramidase (phage lysozyme)/beta-lactamase class A
LSKPVQVQAGQKLGNVLGHHLDFGVKANGRYINPQVFLANLAKGDYGAIASQPPATAKTKANTVTPASQSKGESVIRMQRLGQKDEFGLEKIQLAVIKQGKIVDRFIVNSGKADTQIFGGAGETKAGAKQPVEFGSYRLGKTTPSGNKAKMGNEFIRLEPDFKTERTAIGFHIDKDRLVDPGSSGCIVFANEAEFNKFKQALKSTGIKSFVFDQAVGAVEIAKNVASQVKPLPKSGNRAFDASNIVSKNKLQSLVVQELSTGRLLGSINSNVSPVSSASTVKLIVADLMTDVINQGTATLQETLTIKPGEVAQWSAINKSGQKRRISELLTQMIVKSDNTAANVLINRLGGLDKLNQLAAAKGYTNTKFNKYFLLPGEDTKKGNVSTAGDITSAARELLVTNSPSDKLAADALRKTRNFKYQGEVGGKIGNNSKIIGNVGVVSINGKLYLVTAFANTNGNDLTNRKFITNATNDVVKQIQGMQSSELQTIPTQAKPRRKRQPVPILPPVPGTIGIKNSSGISQGGNDLSPEEYAKLTPLGKQLYELRKNKYILALANAVANAEGSDFRKNTRNFGYGLTIGGENVTDFSKHPYVGTGRKPTWIKAINDASTAAGRYQMMNFNASIQAAKKQFGKNAMPDMFKLTDYQGQDQPSFSPGMQDLYFTYSLKSRGVLDQVLAGKVDTSVLNKLAQHYASIQSGKYRSAHPGQGTPQGQHSNFLKTYEKNLKILNSAQMSGSAIDPNKLQGSLVEGAGISAKTAETRYETQRLTTEAQQQLKIRNVESSINKLLLDTKKAIRLAEINIAESRLNTQSFILDNRFGVSPAQRIPLELDRFDLDIAKRANELQDIIDETSGVTLESIKIKVAPMLEEAAKLGITFDPQQLEEYYQKTFRMNQKRLEESKKLLKDLLLAQPDLRKDKETFLNNQEEVRKTGIGLQTEKLQVGLLQKQIEQRKLLQQLNPLDPRSAKTADLEANLALKNADVDYREKLNNILSEEGKSLSVEEAKRRRNLAKEEFELNKQNIELKRRSDNITEDFAMPSRLLERVQFIQDSFKGVQESRSSLLKAYGLDFRAEKIDKQLAINNQQMDFAKATLQLDDFIRKNAEATEANKLTNEQINTLRENLKLTNEAKLDAIKLQFSELGTVVKGVTSSFRGGFKEFLLSTKGFGESVSDLFNSIMKGFLDPLADMASKRMTDALFGWTEGLFGNKKKDEKPTDGINAVKGLADLSVGANGLNLAGMTLNQAGQMLMQAALTLSSQTVANTAMDAGGGLLGSIFSAIGQGSGLGQDGSFIGDVLPNNSFNMAFAGGMVEKLPMFANGGIVGALNKERSITGRKPHLIVASEGERVLNHRETAIWNKLQSGVAGFANGGVVGAGGNGSMASKIGNTTTINVPVSVEVGSDSEVDTYRLSQAVQAMVSDGIRREMRVGGSIHRGNPYGR